VQVSHTAIDGVVHVTVAGDVDMLTADDLRQVLHELIRDGATRQVIVDVARVEFCDSSGINALLDGYRTALAAGARLQIADPSAQVRQVLQITDLLELLTADSRDAPQVPSNETPAPR
jgi:anti-sigma B factor antagonist